MKIKEIRSLSTEELANQLEAAHHELFDLRFRLATKQLVNHRQVRVTRKTIARLETIIRENSASIR